MELKYEVLTKILKNMRTSELVRIHNAYCEKNHYSEIEIKSMEEFDEYFNDTTPTRIAELIYNGNFRPSDSYFCLTNLNELHSFEFADDEGSPIYYPELCDYISDGNVLPLDRDTMVGIENILEEEFIKAFFPEDCMCVGKERIERICDEEPFDLFTEDWFDLAETYRYYRIKGE